MSGSTHREGMRAARIEVSNRELESVGLGEFCSLCREAGVRDVAELACHGRTGLGVVDLESPLSEARLAAVEGLEWYERLDRSGDGARYLFEVTSPGLPESLEACHEAGVSHDTVAVTDDGFELTLVGRQRDLVERIGTLEDAGLSVHLRSLSAYDGPAAPLESLTDRQHEVLAAAFERGYFDVPRTASTADVAADLDLDPSTVAEHLQRAERNLLSTVLGVGSRGRA